MSSTLTRPAERYGDGGHRRRTVLLTAVGVVIAALVGWLVWSGYQQARHGVSFETQGHDVLDDSRVLVTFSVTQQPGHRAQCQVEALSSGAAQVGLAVVEVGPSSTGSSVEHVTVRTQQRAVTGQVTGCTAQ